MTQLILPRRKFLTGALAFIAAPAIVRASSLMPIKMQEADYEKVWAWLKDYQFDTYPGVDWGLGGAGGGPRT